MQRRRRSVQPRSPSSTSRRSKSAPVEIAAVHDAGSARFRRAKRRQDLPATEAHDSSVSEPAVAAAVAIGFASGDTANPDRRVARLETSPSPAIEPVDGRSRGRRGSRPPACCRCSRGRRFRRRRPFPTVADVVDEDAPDSGGRFGTRKRKTEKAPKRQAAARAARSSASRSAPRRSRPPSSPRPRPATSSLGLARRLARRRDRRRRRGARREPRSPAPSRPSSTRRSFPRPTSASGSRATGSASARSTSRASRTRAASTTPFGSRRTRCCPSRSPSRVLDYRVLEERVGEDGAGDAAGAARRRSARPGRAVPARRDSGRHQAHRDRSRGARSAARVRRAGHGCPGAGRHGDRRRSRSATSRPRCSSAGGGACEFTRVFDWGGGALEEAIAASLEVRPAEAATILRHLSLSGPGRQYEALDDETRAKATDAVRQRLTPFARELVNSLQFYQTQAESLGIGGILVTGGTSHLEGLDDALHQMIGVDVSVGDPLARVDPRRPSSIRRSRRRSARWPSRSASRSRISRRAASTCSRRARSRRSREPLDAHVDRRPGRGGHPARGAQLPLPRRARQGRRQPERSSTPCKAEIAALPPPKAPGDRRGRRRRRGRPRDRGRAGARWPARLGRGLPRPGPRAAGERLALDPRSSPSRPRRANLADGTTAAAPSPLPGQAAAAPTAVSIDGFTYTQPDVARLLARLATLPSLQRVTLHVERRASWSGRSRSSTSSSSPT